VNVSIENKETAEKIHRGNYTSFLDLCVSFIASNVQDCDLQSLLYTIVQWITVPAPKGLMYSMAQSLSCKWYIHSDSFTAPCCPLCYTELQHIFSGACYYSLMRLNKFNERSTLEGLKMDMVVKRFIKQVELNIEFLHNTIKAS
ncbi:hypothetical protein HID58_005823, partial [Brassica napus]